MEEDSDLDDAVFGLADECPCSLLEDDRSKDINCEADELDGIGLNVCDTNDGPPAV